VCSLTERRRTSARWYQRQVVRDAQWWAVPHHCPPPPSAASHTPTPSYHTMSLICMKPRTGLINMHGSQVTFDYAMLYVQLLMNWICMFSSNIRQLTLWDVKRDQSVVSLTSSSSSSSSSLIPVHERSQSPLEMVFCDGLTQFTYFWVGPCNRRQRSADGRDASHSKRVIMTRWLMTDWTWYINTLNNCCVSRRDSSVIFTWW